VVVGEYFQYPAQVAQRVSPDAMGATKNPPAQCQSGLGTFAALAEFVTRPQAENQIGADECYPAVPAM
jgi:hypothetical protein